LFTKIKSFLDNVEKYGTARQATVANITRCMRFAWLINKAGHTLVVCNTCCFSIAIMVSRTRLNATFTRTLSLCYFSRTPVTIKNTHARERIYQEADEAYASSPLTCTGPFQGPGRRISNAPEMSWKLPSSYMKETWKKFAPRFYDNLLNLCYTTNNKL
jgi:hypothetical protein